MGLLETERDSRLPETERESVGCRRERKGEGEVQIWVKFGAKFFPPAGYVSNSILFYNKKEKKKRNCHVPRRQRW